MLHHARARLLGVPEGSADRQGRGCLSALSNRSAIPVDGFRRGLNSKLPPAIAVVAADEVAAEFDARRSSRGKHSDLAAAERRSQRSARRGTIRAQCVRPSPDGCRIAAPVSSCHVSAKLDESRCGTLFATMDKILLTATIGIASFSSVACSSTRTQTTHHPAPALIEVRMGNRQPVSRQMDRGANYLRDMGCAPSGQLEPSWIEPVRQFVVRNIAEGKRACAPVDVNVPATSPAASTVCEIEPRARVGLLRLSFGGELEYLYCLRVVQAGTQRVLEVDLLHTLFIDTVGARSEAPAQSLASQEPATTSEANDTKPGGTCCPEISGDDCPNGYRDAGEECDGTDFGGDDCFTYGFDGGSLSCQADCTVDTSTCTGTSLCQNGHRDPSEECDGTDFGGDDCTTYGFDKGTLACQSSCHVNTCGCFYFPELCPVRRGVKLP